MGIRITIISYRHVDGDQKQRSAEQSERALKSFSIGIKDTD